MAMMTQKNGFTRRGALRLGMGSAAAATLAARPMLAQAAPLRIALAAPMTGDSASMGLNAQRGAAAAMKLIEAAGGPAVTFDIFDDMGQPREAASVARRITDSGDYDLVVGHVNSSCTLAAMPIYADYEMPVLCGSSSNSQVTESGWENIVRMTIRDDYGAQQYSAFAVNNLGKKKMAILFANDDYGRGLRDKMVIAADALGAEVVAEAGFTPNLDKDFSSIVSQFKNAGAEAFMLNCNYTEGGLFLGQAKSAGVEGIATVGPDSLLYNEYIELAQGAAEGSYILAAYDPYADSDTTRAFMSGFREAYDALPSQVAVFTSDLFILAHQLMAAGSTPASLIGDIKATEFQGVGGTYHWDAKGDVKDRTFAVITVKDGKFASTGAAVDETGLDALR
ncbi:ABC transporter substrate-binding protein [Poseidonocella sp. HB161398]|uniref:ABC transporter substrate-binding protein n=1 Tax=Poseidonocella sp. HB161398 TaxID=2320855 RepID=UPI001485E01C|nr:ABC transporter substrate-binding protein [Poseidonocella sp. HB161398]